MTQKQSFAVLVVHAIVALSILLAATVLCYSGKLDASAVVGLFGTAIALLGVNSGQLGQQIINGGPKPNYDKLAVNDPEAFERLMQRQDYGKGHGPNPDAPPAPPAAPAEA